MKSKCEKPGCGKKLDLTAFACKCQKKFCTAHRYAVEHDCSFDYRGNAKEELMKFMSSPVVAAKIDVI
jgi:hypothetical protein